MSDTKWRKLFVALDRPDLQLDQCIIKFIDVEEAFRMGTPTRAHLHPPWPYFDTIRFGPVTFLSIEWLEFPATAEWPRRNNVPSRRVPQSLDRALEILAHVGHFPVERTPDALRIVGHIRRHSIRQQPDEALPQD